MTADVTALELCGPKTRCHAPTPLTEHDVGNREHVVHRENEGAAMIGRVVGERRISRRPRLHLARPAGCGNRVVLTILFIRIDRVMQHISFKG